MKFLHTSDWHLGRRLYGRGRYDEFSAFLDWLAALIEQEGVKLVLIAGDVFDTTTPSNRAQELYYRFLCQVAGHGERHIIITSGNHDSPSFLNAPKELLRAMNVHVIAQAASPDQPEDELVVVQEPGEGNQTVLVCAVPYLRDRDLRSVEPGETLAEKNEKLIAGLRSHYQAAAAAAEQKREALLGQAGGHISREDIPIIGMGHLFTSGGKTVDGDGVRELYVGSLAHVGEDIFPPVFSYLALGHLHVPQQVGKSGTIRYSGSPLPMGFGEATQEKSVVLGELSGQELELSLHPVPCFQQLVRVAGDMETIIARLTQLKEQQSRCWLEVEYTGTGVVPGLRDRIAELLDGSAMEIRRIKNSRIVNHVLSATTKEETLDDLSVHDVFTRCLEVSGEPEEEYEALRAAYDEIVRQVQEEDIREQ